MPACHRPAMAARGGCNLVTLRRCGEIFRDIAHFVDMKRGGSHVGERTLYDAGGCLVCDEGTCARLVSATLTCLQFGPVYAKSWTMIERESRTGQSHPRHRNGLRSANRWASVGLEGATWPRRGDRENRRACRQRTSCLPVGALIF